MQTENRIKSVITTAIVSFEKDQSKSSRLSFGQDLFHCYLHFSIFTFQVFEFKPVSLVTSYICQH